MDFKKKIAEEILSAIECAFGSAPVEIQEIISALEVPPDTALGDYAFPCFKLSKALRLAPPMISDKLSAAIDADFLKEVQSVKGYLNFFIDRTVYAREVLKAVEREGDKYGSAAYPGGRKIVVEFSSINIAKRFHIGHLSTTMIGNALCRMYEFTGNETVTINHLGDWGTQFGKMLCAYKKWGDKETVEKGGVDEMTKLYVRFDREAQLDPSLEDEARAWFKKIEDGDREALEIFEWFKDVTLKDAERVYDLLNVKFDYYTGESFYQDKMGAIVDTLSEKGLLIASDGAQIVDLEAYGMPPCLILKRDGTTLYATRDLATAVYRKNTYDFDECLYVVAYQQDLHFKQVFKVLELMGYDWAKNLHHIPFGMVSYEGQALKTRKGHVVYLDDVLERAIEKAKAIMQEKSPDLENMDEVARQVGVGAAVFFDLYNNKIKDIDFWWDRALNFDGETGPYVQYTHARCSSVLRKAECSAEPDFTALQDEYAQDVVRTIEQFPETVAAAIERYEPSMVTRYAVDLAQAYNKFYYEQHILTDDMGTRAARLLLTKTVKHVIKTALYLIGIEAPERM